MLSVYPDMEDILDWSAEQMEEIIVEEIPGADRITDLDFKLRQLNATLLHLTEEEANDLVANCNHGAEAWRKLSKAYDPSTGTRARHMLKHILYPGRCNETEIEEALER